MTPRFPPYILTFDTDWAPDLAINYLANILIENRVKATWFITHNSPGIERLKEFPELFELGAHPNFFPGSTHGNNYYEVWKTIRQIVPQAKGIRTHGLYQSTRYYIEAIEQGFLYDTSTFLPEHPNPIPTFFRWGDKKILKIPFVWEDDICFSSNKDFSLKFETEQVSKLEHGKNDDLFIPRVLNFHPIHIFLNTASPEEYSAWKKLPHTLQYSKKFITEEHQKDGTRTAFKKALELCKERSMRLIDFVNNMEKKL